MNDLAHELVAQMPRLTALKMTDQAMSNTESNQSRIKKSVLDIDQGAKTSGSSAVIIGAGPSLHLRNSVPQLVEANYSGTVIAADGALSHCLRNGLIPDYVVILDPHPTRIVRWFGDPNLTAPPADDYFRRQDLDPYLGEQELTRNRELIELVDKHGPNIGAIICTSVSNAVVDRCQEAGMELYWWNPIYDDYTDTKGLTQKVFDMNKVPCMTSGGNSGSAAWVSSHTVLGKKTVALTGIDFSYAPGTPIKNTQYSEHILDLFGDRISEFFIHIHNPYLDETWFCDPAYYWYRESFLEMVKDAECKTFNCTEGGILFGEGVDFVPLSDFLAKQIDQ